MDKLLKEVNDGRNDVLRISEVNELWKVSDSLSKIVLSYGQIHYISRWGKNVSMAKVKLVKTLGWSGWSEKHNNKRGV